MLFIGDDWAEDHHDVELVDDDGQVLARRRLPEGIGGIAGLHAPVEPGKPPVTRQIGVAATWITLLALGGWTLWMLVTVNL